MDIKYYVPTKQDLGNGVKFTHLLMNTGQLPDDMAWYPDISKGKTITNYLTQERFNHIIAHFRWWKRMNAMPKLNTATYAKGVGYARSYKKYLTRFGSQIPVPNEVMKHWLEIA